MEQFKESEAYQEIIKELHYLKIEKQTANFDCYVDGLFCYYYKQDEYYSHEFCIICDDIMLANMPILELLDLKRVKYFKHTVYDIYNPNGVEKFIVKKEWRDGDNEYLESE